MAEFKKNTRFGSASARPSHGAGAKRPYTSRSTTDRDDGPKELFKAECSSCHKTCMVPFRPNGKKAVFCSDCFKRDDDRADRPRFEKRDYGSPTRTTSAPSSRLPDPRIDDIKRELVTMNATLLKLVSALEASTRKADLSEEVRKHLSASTVEVRD